MSLSVTPQVEAKVRAAAQRKGVDINTLLTELVDEPKSIETDKPFEFQPTGRAVEYLRKRLADEYTDDPEELRKAEADLEELKRNMNLERSRSGAEPIF